MAVGTGADRIETAITVSAISSDAVAATVTVTAMIDGNADAVAIAMGTTGVGAIGAKNRKSIDYADSANQSA